MKIAVLKERATGESRVAATPETVKKFAALGASVAVEEGAGAGASISDEAYREAGAEVGAAAAVVRDAEIVLGVAAPETELLKGAKPGAWVAAIFDPFREAGRVQSYAKGGWEALAMELMPRITRAQSMDVLSSQANLAGYKAVIAAADAYGRAFPMMMTAAGTVQAARVFVMGVGVAGLQAIATARRLGAVVSAFDVRAAAREQVQSLGATFVAAELVSKDAEDKGGYAKAQSDTEQERTLAAIGAHLKAMDLVITTAQIPGRPAPRLITAAMVATMRAGSVIVDLAAETGGNCEVTRAGETITVDGVTIMGPVNLASTLPAHASQMFGKNVLTLLQHLIKDGALRIDPADEITGAMLIAHNGETRRA